MNQLVPVHSHVEDYRRSTEAADLCKQMVVAAATTIQGRKFVNVEGWQAIAIAHGCAAGARDVERVEGGVRAIGEVRRMSDGAVISTAEGFVGEDEPTWFGGEVQTRNGKKVLPKRADYAIRAMAQTRAISRACRSAFAHVVVMMNAGLSTTPAEEVPDGGFQEAEYTPAPSPAPAKQEPRREEGAPTRITGSQLDQIKALIPLQKTKSVVDIMRSYQDAAKKRGSQVPKDFDELTAQQGDAIIKRLNEIIDQERIAAATGNSQRDEILADEVPY